VTSTIGQGLPFGKVERSQGRTIGEGEFAVLASLTWTTRERNANREFMAGAGETDRELAAPVVVAIVASLAALGPLNRALHEEYGVRTLAAMGLEAEFFGSVRPEDTLWAESEVVSARDSASRPGQGVLTLRDRGVNQRDEVVVVVTRTLLVARDGVAREEAR
jgi:itaconyl-CoA hydratase